MNVAVDDELAESSVFRKPPARSWAVSALAHAGAFAALGALGTYVGVRAGVIPPTIVEFDAPPRRAPPPPPPPPPRAPTPAPPTQPHAARRPSSARPAQRAGHASRSNAPRVMAAAGSGTGGDAMPVGDNDDFRGGTVGNGGGDAPPPPPPPPTDETPAPRPHRAPDEEVAPDELTAVASVRCDEAALARLYPQEALDNDLELSQLAVELLVDARGAIARARVRNDPGFGVASAMERGVVAHCQVVSVARDREGEAVAMRLVKRLRFQFE